jgi:hypothetical protein
MPGSKLVLQGFAVPALAGFPPTQLVVNELSKGLNVGAEEIIERLSGNPIIDAALRVSRKELISVIEGAISVLKMGQNPAITAVNPEAAMTGAVQSLDHYFRYYEAEIFQAAGLVQGIDFVATALGAIADPNIRPDLLSKMADGHLFALATAISGAHGALPEVVGTLVQRLLEEIGRECSLVQDGSLQFLGDKHLMSTAGSPDRIGFGLDFELMENATVAAACTELARLLQPRLEAAGFQVNRCGQFGNGTKGLTVEIAINKTVPSE